MLDDSTRAFFNRESRLFQASLRASVYFVAVLWAVHLADIVVPVDFGRFGIVPRSPEGARGILFAPLLHGDFTHLISNSVPLVVLGTGLLYLYRRVSWWVVLIVYVLGGAGVWLFARPASVHIGASGLIYGFAAFIFFSGLLRRDPPSIALALVVTFLYGGMVWGVLPLEDGVSFEAHLAGALSGILCAVLFRNAARPPNLQKPPGDDDDYPEDEDELDDPARFDPRAAHDYESEASRDANHFNDDAARNRRRLRDIIDEIGDNW